MSPFLLLKIELVMTCLPTETGSLWKSRNIIDLKIVSLHFTWKTYMTVFIICMKVLFFPRKSSSGVLRDSNLKTRRQVERNQSICY